MHVHLLTPMRLRFLQWSTALLLTASLLGSAVLQAVPVDAGTLQGAIVASSNAKQINDTPNGISCVGSTFCMTVGGFKTQTGITQPDAQDWNGTAWSLTTVPSPSTANTSVLESVSCTGTSFCVAVGYYYTGTVNQTLIEQWNGTAWSIVASANSSATQSNELKGVSCTATTFCIAAGYFAPSSYSQNLVEQWGGTSWTIVATPDAGTSAANSLRAVACTTSSFCMAAGSYLNASNTDTLALIWSGSSWTLSYPSNPSTYQTLGGVSCTSATYCVAAGNYQSTNVFNLAESWNGATWTNLAATSPGTANDYLASVSCASASLCKVAGTTGSNSSYPAPNVATWNGTSWSTDTVPAQSPTSDENILAGISCTGASFCMAVGEYYPNVEYAYSSAPLAVQWNGTSWSLDAAATSPLTVSNDLKSVSCASTSFCLSVGNDSQYNWNAPTAQLWNGSTWSLYDPGTSVFWTGYSTALLSVSCPTASFCFVVGHRYLSTSAKQTFTAY